VNQVLIQNGQSNSKLLIVLGGHCKESQINRSIKVAGRFAKPLTELWLSKSPSSHTPAGNGNHNRGEGKIQNGAFKHNVV